MNHGLQAPAVCGAFTAQRQVRELRSLCTLELQQAPGKGDAAGQRLLSNLQLSDAY